MTPLQERFKEAIENRIIVPHHKNAETLLLIDDCEKIADEFAEEFTLWVDDSEWTFHQTHKIWVGYDPTKRKTTSQLLQQFKDERK